MPLLPKAINNDSPVKGILSEIGSWSLDHTVGLEMREGQRQRKLSSLGISASKAVTTQEMSREMQRMSSILIFKAFFFICNCIVPLLPAY